MNFLVTLTVNTPYEAEDYLGEAIDYFVYNSDEKEITVNYRTLETFCDGFAMDLAERACEDIYNGDGYKTYVQDSIMLDEEDFTYDLMRLMYRSLYDDRENFAEEGYELIFDESDYEELYESKIGD